MNSKHIFVGLGIFLLATCIVVFAYLFTQSSLPTDQASVASASTRRLNTNDQQLNKQLRAHNVQPLQLTTNENAAQIELGRLLFFDKIVSGNQDISCATCHHPTLATADSLPLSIGVGGDGLGQARSKPAEREFIPRHAPDLFNRGVAEWETMFWDGRVEISEIYGSSTPAGDVLPIGLDNPLAVQALFPPTSRDEMRGHTGELTVHAAPNELGNVVDGDFDGIWDGIMDRLLAIPEYEALFQAAYPNVARSALGIKHFANAIAAFEIAAFSFDDAAWDQFLAGQPDALTANQLAGARLFYGEAGCASCHSGTLLTDQQFYNLGVPQYGPGKDESFLDKGRWLATGEESDLFAFRTPPLRNVALTAPYMHNGACATLEEAVRFHLEPDSAGVMPCSAENVPAHLDTYKVMIHKPAVSAPLTEEQIGQLLAFLEALTSPSAADLSHLIPDSVPSGLPVDR